MAIEKAISTLRSDGIHNDDIALYLVTAACEIFGEDMTDTQREAEFLRMAKSLFPKFE